MHELEIWFQMQEPSAYGSVEGFLTWEVADARTVENARGPFRGEFERHLLRGAQNPCGAAQDGKAAKSSELKAAFEKHIAETEGQVDRIQQVFKMLKRPAKGKTCPAILGLTEEADEVMEDFGDSSALDAGLLSGAQAVEHYEMARYGTLIAWANQLGMKDAANLLNQTLEEEKKTDAALSKLAPAVNQSAV